MVMAIISFFVTCAVYFAGAFVYTNIVRYSFMSALQPMWLAGLAAAAILFAVGSYNKAKSL